MVKGTVAAAVLAALVLPGAAQAQPQSSLLPWPNDALTTRDKTTDTGRRLNLPLAGMPHNKDGVPIDPTDMNRADGFSPGSMIIVRVPGLDNPEALRRSRLPSLKTASGQPITWRGKRHLAWHFTVASERSLAGRMLHIRDDAFRQLGDGNLRDLTVSGKAPAFTITGVTDLTPAEDDRIARRVDGTIAVPCYLTSACAPGGQFTFDAEGLPQQHGTTSVPFTCRVPRSALDPADPPRARPSLYGHGLLGSAGEVNAGNVRSMANEHNFVFCATAWAGFSSEDVLNVLAAIGDLSRFNTVADRMQQGFLNALLLGRLMIHPQGLSSHPAFQKNGRSVIDTRRLFFDGNSQGGIMGGGLTAVAPDFDRAVLGVPGMNYSTLLQRSVDFDLYAQFLYPAYPDEATRQLVFALIQLLWDRGEANGYAQHMTGDPPRGTPPHQVLMHVAFGDHQVSDTTAEVEARTIGAHGYQPVLDPGRSPWVRFQLIPPIGSFPFSGSAIVMWDSGTPAPPITNTPNRAGEDPHSHPRSTPAARVQKSEFLKIGGRVVDVCGGAPCHTAP